MARRLGVLAWVQQKNHRGKSAVQFSRHFGQDEGGVTAIIFGIVFAVLMFSIGLGIDYTRAVTEQLEEQSALDAAILAAAHQLGKEDEATKGEEVARAFFQENLKDSSTAKINDINFDAAGGKVDASAGTLMKTHILKIFGFDNLDIGVTASVAKGDGTVEVAMVLDNSGSMSGSYIADLKIATQDLANLVLDSNAAASDKVQMGLVPFAASVNVGSLNAGAAWIDTGAQSSIHSENFDQVKSRFDLFSDLGQSWAGCVEARPAPYDVNDTAPNLGVTDTMFVPMFAPDEPDSVNASNAGYSNYSNNYISDFGGDCPTPTYTCTRRNSKTGECTRWSVDPISVTDAQARTCKYKGASITGGSGPNYMCTTTPIQPLTSDETTISDAITALGAGGYTNIAEGVAWGWRVLSPGEPFTNGREYTDEKNKKFLIVMTDGQNVYSAKSDHNLSRYGARGYASKGRLGTTYTGTGYRTSIDTKTQSTCTAAKAEGVIVYTVAFRLESDANTTALLRSCATSDDHFFPASNGSALIQSFQNIGREISNLRVSG